MTSLITRREKKSSSVTVSLSFIFAKEFGLTYYAAFPGCSTDTEANPATIAFLVDKVKEDHIPVVFHIEMSNEQMSKAIAEATGAKNRASERRPQRKR